MGFLQDRREAGRVYALAIEPGPECQIHLERVTNRQVLISCPGDYDWGNAGDNQKFVFDVNSKRMVQYYSYRPFSYYVLIKGRRGPIFMASDEIHPVAASWDANANDFRMLSETETKRLLDSDASKMRLDDERRPTFPPQAHAFGPGKKFELYIKPPGMSESGPIIMEHTSGATRKFPLPQSSWKEWKAKRPDDAKSIMPTSAVEFDEQIGPYQIDGDRFWFGKSFYNGEGSSGVGGFGYFDPESRSYKLYEPAEIVQWSVSAFLLEPNAAWLGLAHYGEGGDVSGGLLRWDRATESAQRFNLSTVTRQIIRWGDALYLASGEGIEVMRGNQIDRYIVDASVDGKYHVIACEGGYR